MEAQHNCTMGVDPYGKYFLIMQDESYSSELFDNRLELFREIESLINQCSIELENAIYLIDELTLSFLPNLPRDFHLNGKIEMYCEYDLLGEILDLKQDLEIDRIVSELDELPCLFYPKNKDRVVNIYFEIPNEINNDEPLIEYSEDIGSKHAAYEWVNNNSSRLNMTAIQKDKLLEQIKNDKNLPEYEKLIPLEKEEVKFVNEYSSRN